MRVHMLLVLGFGAGLGGGGAAGCDGDPAPGTDAAPLADAAPADAAPDAARPFALTSPTITEAGTIPAAHTCDGEDQSPALAWTAAPAEALSFALVVTDTTNGLIHSVIYDIPGARTELPAALEKVYAPASAPGVHQVQGLGQTGQARGYVGPCPPAADAAHTYELALYAISVPALTGAQTSTTRAQAVALVQANMVADGVTRLTAIYDRN